MNSCFEWFWNIWTLVKSKIYGVSIWICSLSTNHRFNKVSHAFRNITLIYLCSNGKYWYYVIFASIGKTVEVIISLWLVWKIVWEKWQTWIYSRFIHIHRISSFIFSMFLRINKRNKMWRYFAIVKWVFK